LEKRIAKLLSDDYMYEDKGSKLSYEIPHEYTPDFVHPVSPRVQLEVKGYFRTSAEASKYVHIKRDNPDIELIFIFNNAFKKAHPNCRPRVDGSVLTLDEWCKKHEFLYYEEKSLPSNILEGRLSPRWIRAERKLRGFKC
jgi:hypothetical protein